MKYILYVLILVAGVALAMGIASLSGLIRSAIENAQPASSLLGAALALV